ncbi:hypothetical protein LO763_07615 [Glycomyces sp. A-F 0318]|uniref:hypothetical protein n=1 Tax=Glycomyces amatae TaxID=2881355 RepID=UPI001E5BD748|nr:hypothetical protein [Glycomyces amatae]MCD0443493.1 hypothetical protein [Glycomyces amatae]
MSHPRVTLATGGARHRLLRASGLPAAIRSRRIALAAALLAAFALVPLSAAPASAQESCSGVTVVVDFGPLAPEPATGCAADPADGLDALAQAGFAVTEVAAIRGMVCRIDELPETDCGGAPPADEYWSYWHAETGDAEWTYSPVGGAYASPGAGDVEGWVFGDGASPPAIAPADAAAPAADANADDGSGGSLTWLAAVAVLAVIAGLVVWRRRGRRA